MMFTKPQRTRARCARHNSRSRNVLVVGLGLVLGAVLSRDAHAQDVIATAAKQYLATASKLDPASGIPRATSRTGQWAFSGVNYWTSGFYAGTLWYLAAATKNPALQAQAERWTLPLADIPFGSFSHDLGFEFNTSFMNAYRFTAQERFRGPALNAARLLALRFNPTVGAIKSWDWMPPERPFPVIADNMMNLELLFWGARQSNGDKRWRDIAVQHARTTLANHVRPDGGSYHVISFDPNTGKVLERFTHQGFANESTWSRGQAWLIYGFTMTFRETGDPTFLAAAQKVADYFITHLPNDGVPCWDFNAPGCPETANRDASAAAIAASGLLELSTYVPRAAGERYRAAADAMLRVLSSEKYRTGKTAALIEHAVGNYPGHSEVDVGLVYGDYYYIEALLRQKQLQGDTALHFMPVRLPVTYTTRPDLLRKAKERLERGDVALRSAVAKLIADANAALHAGPFTVTAKERTPPSGDKHDYVSYAPYWWPDSTKPNGLPFIRRDGEVNPVTRRDSDVLRWYAMTDAVETLAQAFYFTGDNTYADRAALLLRTWFIDPATRMNPNQNYGQAIPGVVEGRGIGLIDLRDFGRLLDAVSLLETSRAWGESDDRAFRDWTAQYLTWLKTSKNGIDEAGEKNNHGTWYDVQRVALDLFVGDTADARAIAAEARTKRIASEIDSAGKQPLELARTRSLHYSVENLEGMTRLAEMAQAVGVDLWKWQAPNGASIRKAIDYVAPYVDTTKAWPGQQITKEADDLFVPLLLRARIALGDARYATLLDKLPARVIEAHRAHLLYPLPHESADCDEECLVLRQAIANGRRTAWIEKGRWYNTASSASALLRLMQAQPASSAVRNAVNGAAAWLKDVALYKDSTGPFWVARYDISTNAPVSMDSLTSEPAQVLAQYQAWSARFASNASVKANAKADAVVDANFKGPSGADSAGVRMFRSIAAALNAAPPDSKTPFVIAIRNGRYDERIIVDKPNVQFIGQSRDSTILSYDVAAGYKSPTGGIYGTRGSFVLRVAAPGFRLSNMTVENTFDYPANYAKPNTDSTKLRDSQGVAVMLDSGSDRAVFENCTLSGHQDTLFPNAGRSYFHHCVILGSVDFIFGAGRAVFDDVDIISRDRGSKTNNGYITAPSTPRSQPYGFLIINSRLKKESAVMATNTVSLGRPWHPSSDPNAVGSAVFINTWMDDHIGAKGWDDMNSVDAAGVRTLNKAAAARFFEYHSSGPGAVSSATRRVLSAADARKYTIAKVLDGWKP